MIQLLTTHGTLIVVNLKFPKSGIKCRKSHIGSQRLRLEPNWCNNNENLSTGENNDQRASSVLSIEIVLLYCYFMKLCVVLNYQMAALVRKWWTPYFWSIVHWACESCVRWTLNLHRLTTGASCWDSSARWSVRCRWTTALRVSALQPTRRHCLWTTSSDWARCCDVQNTDWSS